MNTNEQHTVVIIGGGIAGLTAAHLLCEQGIAVTVIECAKDVGGQARSDYTDVNYPTEHALRIIHDNYLCFYQILSQLKAQNFIDAQYNLSDIDLRAVYKEYSILYRSNKKGRISLLKKTVNLIRAFLLTLKIGMSFKELFRFAKLQYLQMLCEDHLVEAYDHMDVKALLYLNDCSEIWLNTIFKIVQMGGGVQARSSAILALAVLDMGIETLKNINSLKMFSGPNQEALFNPWKRYLINKGVRFLLNTKIKSLQYSENNIISCISEKDEVFTHKHYILACNYQAAKTLIKNSKLTARINLEEKILDQCFEWVNGAQFYFFQLPQNKFGLYPGLFTFYLDSPWSIITAIQGKDFWRHGGVTDPELQVMGVSYSSELEGGVLYNKPLPECTLDEIKQETLAQTHLSNEAYKCISWNLDQALQFLSYEQFKKCQENFSQDATLLYPNYVAVTHNQLFVPIPGYYGIAPLAKTPITNLHLAGEYCHTAYKAPAMEKAAESGFHAVNSVLEKLNIKAISLPYNYDNHCYKVMRKLDCFFYNLGC